MYGPKYIFLNKMYAFLYFFLLWGIFSCTCNNREIDSCAGLYTQQLPRLIIGRGHNDVQTLLIWDKHTGRKNVPRLVVNPQDITIDLGTDGNLHPDIVHDAWDQAVIQKIKKPTHCQRTCPSSKGNIF